jgi:hypothetical protein
MQDRAAREQRLAFAQAATQAELALAGMAVILAPFLFLAAPGFMGPQPPRLEVVGVFGPIIGLAWMIRIRRADPEAGPSPFRYHDW